MDRSSNFVCVFSEKDRDALTAAGYRFLQADDRRHIYMFVNSQRLTFGRDPVVDKILCAFTDTLVL